VGSPFPVSRTPRYFVPVFGRRSTTQLTTFPYDTSVRLSNLFDWSFGADPTDWVVTMTLHSPGGDSFLNLLASCEQKSSSTDLFDPFFPQDSGVRRDNARLRSRSGIETTPSKGVSLEKTRFCGLDSTLISCSPPHRRVHTHEPRHSRHHCTLKTAPTSSRRSPDSRWHL
jgi:hypothetical protein